MKKIILLGLLCLFIMPSVSSQETNFEETLSPQQTAEYYQDRFKKKRGTARAFLFSGIGAMIVGGFVISGANDWGEVGGGGLLFSLGAVSTLVSIPLFIKAGSFKRKAKEARASMNMSLGAIRSPERTDFGVGLSYNF